MQGHVRRPRREQLELRAYIGRDATTKRARYKTRTFKGSKRDADRAMRAFLAEVDRGSSARAPSASCSSAGSRWASTTRDWSPKGIAETRRIIDTRLGPLSPIARQAPDADHRRVLRASCGRTVALVGIDPVSRTTVTCARSGLRSRPPPCVAYTP